MRLLDLKASPILRFLSSRKKAPAEQQADKLAYVDAVRRLIQQPEWDTYRRMLDLHVSANVQALLAGSTDAEVHRLRGYIQGLLHSVQIAENLVQESDNVGRREQRAATASEHRERSQRAALYSSGHWGN